MAKRLPPQQRAMNKAKAALGEHFDAAVIIVPVMVDGDSHIAVEFVGHNSFGKGLIEDAYNKLFDDMPDYGASGEEDSEDDGSASA